MKSQRGVMGAWLVVPTMILFAPTPAFAQYFFGNQLSVGLGAVTDRQPRQTAITGAFSLAVVDGMEGFWPYRLGWVLIEGELGSRSDLEPCQSPDAGSTNPPDCSDAALLSGLRFNVFHRKSTRRVFPFVGLLVGGYWKASGLDDPGFDSGHFAIQPGGGIDLRRVGSVHALRLALDYRRVIATSANRNQLRFLISYVFDPAGVDDF
jgi:hypothetical protein